MQEIWDTGLVPGLGRSPGEGHSNPLQHSCLENPMDREAWQATVHRVAQSWTQLKRLSTHPYRATVSQRELYSILYNDLNGNIIYMYTYLMCMHMKIPESPLGSKETKPFSLKGNQSWILTGKTDAEIEALVFLSSDVNRWLAGKVPDVGKDWGQKEKRVSENEMVGWHSQCNGHELRQT